MIVRVETGRLTLTREQVRELDRRAIEEYGIDSIVLMENAGRACAAEAARIAGDASNGPVLVLCGPGNNGGDGFVIARTLANRGFEVELALVAPLAKLASASQDVRKNAELWKALGGEIEEAADAAACDRLAGRAMDSALIVDALFGTGLTRPLRAPYADLVPALNAVHRPVLAVDLPSGLDANTGEILGVAVEATATVTFVAEKPGFARGAGPRLCGRVVVAEIGIPAAFVEEALFEER